MTDAPLANLTANRATNAAADQPPAPRDHARVRVAILADTHGWVDPRVLAVVADCDLAVHGGDVGNAAVIAQLQPRRGTVWAARGNNDRPSQWPAGDRATLDQLPNWAKVSLPGGELVVIHGHQTPARGRHERLRRRFPQARVLVYGHSHRLLLDQEARPWVLNPGAAGRTRTHGGPSCLVLNAATDDWAIEVFRFVPRAAVPRKS